MMLLKEQELLMPSVFRKKFTRDAKVIPYCAVAAARLIDCLEHDLTRLE